MSMNNRKIAGFMSAESIYSLAFYILMVAAIAGIGAGVLSKSDAAKAASGLSLLRANFKAESAVLGYPAAPGAAAIERLSGGMFAVSGADAIVPGAGAVTMTASTHTTGGFIIAIAAIDTVDVCNALAGTGFNTWAALGTAISSAGTVTGSISTKSDARTACQAAATAPVGLAWWSN